MDNAAVKYETLTEALQNLYFEPAKGDGVTQQAREFATALRVLTNGDVANATNLFDKLIVSSSGGVNHFARRIRMELHYNAGEYKQLVELREATGGKAGAMEQTLAKLPAETYSFPSRPISTRMRRGPFNIPMVEVEANGQRRNFAFDTGADFSVVTETLGKELGVTLVDGGGISMDTTTSKKVPARFGWLKRIAVGSVVIENHHVLVLSDAALTWKSPEGKFLSVEGIVGWNAIRNVRAQIDFGAGHYRFEAPLKKADSHRRNLFWLGYPAIKLTDAKGQKLVFAYDSGSGNTSIRPNIFKKRSFAAVRNALHTVAGAGGIETTEGPVVDQLSLVITGYRFDIRDVAQQQDNATGFKFLSFDGVIGSDIAQSCAVTVDFQNAYYAMKCPSARLLGQ